MGTANLNAILGSQNCVFEKVGWISNWFSKNTEEVQ